MEFKLFEIARRLSKDEQNDYASYLIENNKYFHDCEPDYIIDGYEFLYFNDPRFNTLLLEFLDENGKSPEQIIRGYKPMDDGLNFIMVHGNGYQWVSAELLGGAANDVMSDYFSNWMKNKGHSLDFGIIR